MTFYNLLQNRNENKDLVKQKIGSVWTKIHSLLLSLDEEKTGKVSRQIFAKIVDTASNNITEDELTRMIDFIAGLSQEVDYVKLAKDLNLNSERIDLFGN